jgi:hypothetical protein
MKVGVFEPGSVETTRTCERSTSSIPISNSNYAPKIVQKVDVGFQEMKWNCI